MKIVLILFFSSATIIFQSYGQINPAYNLKRKAKDMGAAFLRGDFGTFVKYTYPPIVKSMGGTTKMTQVLEKTINDMQIRGMRFSDIAFDEPSKIIKSGKEYQATIAQHTEIKLAKAKIVSTTTLISISTDDGNNWTFIDTSNKNIAMLRKAFPNLSPLIYLPQQQPPIKYDY